MTGGRLSMNRTVGGAALALLAFCAVASAQDQAMIEAGEQVYDEHCATCHGEKLRSTGAIPDPSLRFDPGQCITLMS